MAERSRAGYRLSSGVEGARRKVSGGSHSRRRLWRNLAWSKKLERRSDPGAGRTADGNPPRLDPDDTHSRYIEASIGGMTVGCLHLPNGNPAPGPKFDYKLRWFGRLAAHAMTLLATDKPIVLA